MFTVRTTKPNSNDKCYITKSNGGWSNCVAGSPTDSECNVLSNCVGLAAGRFNEIYNELTGNTGMAFNTLCCNAENFIEKAEKAGLEISQTPKAGAIMVWQKGDTLKGSDGAGHVCVVEKVIDNNTVYTSESNYGGTAFFNSTRTNDNGRWGIGSKYSFRGFILNPAVKDEPAPAPIVDPTPATAPEVIPFEGVSDEELATRVWTGEFGTDEDRKNALGSRYDAVQALVNKGYGKPAEPAPVVNPEPVNDEINVGDKVVANGRLYGTSYAEFPGKSVVEYHTTVALKVDMARKAPYNIYNDAGEYLGWVTKESLRKDI